MTRADHYTYRVARSEQDVEFVATCLEFPSLSWLAGNQAEALHGLRQVVSDCLADMEAVGEGMPEPLPKRAPA